jgi:hypothetical protein
MIEYSIVEVGEIEGPVDMDLLIKMHFVSDKKEKITLVLSRNAAGQLRHAFMQASASLPPF